MRVILLRFIMTKKVEQFLTVITPTYNRDSLLTSLYDSLIQQSLQTFIWLIVDDGSTDSTERTIQTLKSNFEIQYIKKSNGGKHTALNLAFDVLRTRYFIIVDSDDRLTSNAILRIYNDLLKCENTPNLIGLSYLRMYSEDAIIGAMHKQNYTINTFIDERFNKNIKGDKAEVWKSEFVDTLRFPIFDGERFFPEAYLWIQSESFGNLVFINHSLYVCEYLEGGLTKAGRYLHLKNPEGMKLFYNFILHFNLSLRLRIKYRAMAYSFGVYSNDFYNLKTERNIIIKLTSRILVHYWRLKYDKQE